MRGAPRHRQRPRAALGTLADFDQGADVEVLIDGRSWLASISWWYGREGDRKAAAIRRPGAGGEIETVSGSTPARAWA